MFTAEKLAGFALAALLADDRALQHVESAMTPELAAQVRAMLASLLGVRGAVAERASESQIEDERHRRVPSGERATDDKARLVARLLEQVRPALTDLAPSVPARAASLLAPHLPRRATRASGGPAASVRPGYVPPPDLPALLLRLARAASATRGEKT